ncbi:MAG: hypothetical protein JSS21_06715, partial [Proteobacteria bacterium]|nr:hypothetical protein [Pseudomonadota bacterium]
MTSFEFVFGLISVITSLALTRMLSGCIALYRRADRVRFSWRHALWTATALMVLLGNWAVFWRLRNVQAWSALDVLVPIVFTGVLYAFCDLTLPDETARDEIVDLREYHLREGRRYKLLQLVFAVLAMLLLARTATGIDQWLHAARFALLAAL